MTNREINEAMKTAVNTERISNIGILKLINLAEEHKTHLELGYGSLHSWLIIEHKYSERAANRRIQAARLLRAVPEVSEKFKDGRVNLSTLAKAQSMMRTQEKMTKIKVTPEQKREAVTRIENQSELKAEQMLMALFPENASQVKQDRITVISETTQRLGVNLPNETIADLERAKELLSHTIPSCQAAEVIAYLLKEFIKRNDPVVSKSSATLAHRTSRKKVLRGSNGRCTFKDSVTGRVCGCRIRVERDHIVPRANGGDDSPENARALCRAHNQFMAEKILGKKRANRWRKP